MRFTLSKMSNAGQPEAGGKNSSTKASAFVFPTLSAKREELREKLEQREEPKQYDQYEKAAKIARSEKAKAAKVAKAEKAEKAAEKAEKAAEKAAKKAEKAEKAAEKAEKEIEKSAKAAADYVPGEAKGVHAAVLKTEKEPAAVSISDDMATAQGFDLRALRTGLGFDAHALVKGRKLILGGVEVPHPRGLKGHSDADVLAHAVADALLGAMRGGDIGRLFPNTDPAYKDADSMVLLAQVAAFVRSQGFEIIDVDSVIAAQAPKLSPYRDEMRVNLAQAMGISVENVGVKATTTERLGYEGREEGISATATCLLLRCREA